MPLHIELSVSFELYSSMTEQLNRRTVLQRLLEVAIVLPLGWMGIHAMMPRLGLSKRIQKRSLGPVNELFATKDHVVTTIGSTPAIVFQGKESIEAFSLECTHARCTVRYNDQSAEFVCPCHGGSFHRDGSVKNAPPRKPLQRLFVSQHDGLVYLSDRVL